MAAPTDPFVPGEDLLAALRSRSTTPAPIEQIGLDHGDDPRAVAAETLARGWRFDTYPRVKLDPPLAWDELCSAYRGWSFHLHAWEFMSPVLQAYEQTGDRSLLAWSLALARDWIAQHPEREVDSPFAWYDMAVGLRAFRLAYLIDVASTGDDVDLATLAQLVRSLRLHLATLSDPGEFRAHSNHGVFQAAGQLAAGRRLPELPEAAEAEAQGHRRLRALVRTQFADDGSHLEHSPGYHAIVLKTLLWLRANGVITDADTLSAIERAEDALAWFITPAGSVPRVGDSDATPVAPALEGLAQSECLTYALSGGRSGRAPADRVRVFHEGGYVVARDAWPAPGDGAATSYLLQSCGFHSRVHKQADDLSFVWHARGAELFTDAGRYGYAGRTDPGSALSRLGFYYSDPARIYCESTCAHSCVEIDGMPYPRREVEPYGSALVKAGTVPGTDIVATEARVRHWDVTHTRVLIHAPGAWVLVIDHVIDQERSATHDYVQRFLMGPDLELRQLTGGGTFIFGIPGADEVLALRPLVPEAQPTAARGQRTPNLLGWVSLQPGELTPTWSVGWERRGVRSAAFAMLAVIAPAAEGEPLDVVARMNASTRRGSVRWTSAGVAHDVRWDRHDQPLDVVYRGA